jgi:hypothetical protein
MRIIQLSLLHLLIDYSQRLALLQQYCELGPPSNARLGVTPDDMITPDDDD